MGTCEQCGDTFTGRAGRRFCTDRCRKAHARAVPEPDQQRGDLEPIADPPVTGEAVEFNPPAVRWAVTVG